MLPVCRICLATEIKLYKIQNALKEIYEEATGLHVNSKDSLPQRVCWECRARLVAASCLRRKANRSHQLMLDLLHASCLSTKALKRIDRTTACLKSTLRLKTYEPNHSNLQVQETVTDTFVDVKEEIESNDINFTGDNSSSSDEVLAKHKVKKEKKDKVKKRKKDMSKQLSKVDKRRKPVQEVINEDLFIIKELALDQQIAEVQQRQYSDNYKNSAFKCTDCFKGFSDEDAYNSHIVRHTNQIGAYACEVCRVHFKTNHALRTHAACHVYQFRCIKCEYQTTRRHAAKLHEKFHNGTRYQCPHCFEDFGKLSTYMSHIRIKHSTDWVCALCGFSFISDKGLGLHKTLKHRFDDRDIPPDGPHCDKCDVRFVSEEALETHIKQSTRHNQSIGSRQRAPPQSSNENDPDGKSKKCRQPRSKSEGPFDCEQCDMQLPDALTYFRHFRRVHPDKNRTQFPSTKSNSMCEVCGKMFQSLALLQDHSWTHGSGHQFSCSICHKRFQRRYRLRAHRRLHAASGPSRHVCRLCGKRVATSSNLRRHMLIHTGLKPVKCEMCGKAFKYASEKRVHVTYVHLKKPWPKRNRGERRVTARQQTSEEPSTSASETEIVQPLWPASKDPKIPETLNYDKQVYYN